MIYPVNMREPLPPNTDSTDTDPGETADWLAALQDILSDSAKGRNRAIYLVGRIIAAMARSGAVPFTFNTPYLNTIPPEEEPVYPGDYHLERRIKSLIRWNAMAMVVRANLEASGIGGHIATYASAATLYEVGFNHFFRGRTDGTFGDLIYFQGHASPGIYSRAFLEGRLSQTNLEHFRRELAAGGGLSSYPHPRLMPDFWQFPTVSMGLGPLMAIYQARFNRYLHNRGLVDTSASKVWAFVGDGECDEPETLGAITLASRERLDNLVFVINCNLQRLDGPVRGNGKIIQELETLFRGAGWEVIKVIWGGDWDPLLQADKTGLLAKRMEEALDGDYQKYTVSSGAYIREHFFGKYPELLKLVEHLSDKKLERIARGGHDSRKVYAAYLKAMASVDKPVVILAKTVKGYGLGEAGEGRNIAHSQKKLDQEALAQFVERFAIPLPADVALSEIPFVKPAADSDETRYLKNKRAALGGPLPRRVVTVREPLPIPQLSELGEFLEGSGGREVSTTMGFVRLLSRLMTLNEFGKYVVPIIPDEARTFGMESLFRQFGIYSSLGQLYEPVDKESLVFYFESQNGQILEEGITEAGAMSSFIAAGTAYASFGTPMVPFYIFYSMFGFQRIGDLIWAAGDIRAKGFLLGATAGRTTLMGEGLQHQDGHSHLMASAFPSVCAYDPAFVYEVAILVQDGLRRMYAENEDVIYYLTLYNENAVQRPLPEADRDRVKTGIRKGLYKLETASIAPADSAQSGQPIHLLAAGPILYEAIKAKEILEKEHHLAVELWSVTSFSELRRDALAVSEWNRVHPDDPKQSHIEALLSQETGVFIAASDYVRQVPEQIAPWIPGPFHVLGTDGFGFSETREELRRYFKVDATAIVATARRVGRD